MNNIAILADQYTSLPFSVMGVDIFPVDTIEDAKENFEKIQYAHYKIVFLQEKWAEKLEELLSAREDKLFPVFVVIPDSTGSKGLAENKIRGALEKALGTANW